MEKNESLKQLFQQEFTKMVAVMSRLFGLEHIELAEDIVSETFLQAAESWGVKGLPPNPTAWLYLIAKQKTLYHFRRNRVFQKKIVPEWKGRQKIETEIEEMDFSHQHIRDSQLQMLFAVCDPAIASEAQIGLALRILCGFGIDEIAEAFLTNKETINKRLFRAKEKLRSEGVRMELPPPDAISGRVDNVLRIVYLLFNEGYYSRSRDELLRRDLCVEALRLGLLLTEYEMTRLPKTYALIALMCFHASRFDARIGVGSAPSEDAAVILYDQQDESLWDQALIAKGMRYLGLSAAGAEMSSYHLEARIASWHCIKEDTPEKWSDILRLYDQLLEVNYSPSVALNRTYALYKAKGKGEALAAAEQLKLENNHFYFLLLGELYRDIDKAKARRNFQQAIALAKTQTEKRIIQEKLAALENDE
jgi:RNA polymerase sigma-70 factor (ECF subfamily)